jgi:hypothetical protein
MSLESKFLTKESKEARAAQLTSRLADLHDVFMRITNDSNSITVEALGTLLREQGQAPSDDQLKEMIAAVDVTQTGRIEFNEFVSTLYCGTVYCLLSYVIMMIIIIMIKHVFLTGCSSMYLFM